MATPYLLQLPAVGFRIARHQPYRGELTRAVGMLARHPVVAGIGRIELVWRVVGRIVDEEGVARQRRTVKREQSPSRPGAVRPGEERRDRIVQPLEPAMDRIE